MVAIGIDLGTTYSLVASLDSKGRPFIVKNQDGQLSTPSVVFFPNGPDPIVGRAAKERQELGEEPVAAFFKIWMGESNSGITIQGKLMTPTDFSAILLKKLVSDASATLGVKINDAVITVPAYFEDQERRAVMEAARRSGINVLRLLHEPTAAALCMGLDKKAQNGQTCLVYDLGGGTFDASVIQFNNTGIEVLATKGDHSLGGRDFDARIVEYVCASFLNVHGFDPRTDMSAKGSIQVLCEEAKIRLSSVPSANISFWTDSDVEFSCPLSKNRFEELTADLLERTMDVVRQVLTAYLKRTEKKISDYGSQLFDCVDDVLLVGGSSRIPMISDFLTKEKGKSPLKCVNPDQAVALGAAIQAGNEIQAQGGSKECLSLVDEENGHSLVKCQSHMVLPVLHDITAHTMGMIAESADRKKYVNSKILPKNSPIPNTERKVHELLTDGKRPLEVFVTQGESDEWFQCKVIRKFEFSGIATPAQGVARIEVSYTYNENGIVEAAARQLSPDRSLICKEFPAPSEAELARFHKSPLENDPPPPKPEGAVVLAIDTSGSMGYNMADKPIDKAKRAALDDFVAKIPEEFHVGVVSFDNTANVELECTASRWRIRSAVNGLGAKNAGTRANPFAPAARMLLMEKGKKYVVILSDGQWFQQNQSDVLNGADMVKKMGATVLAIGFGDADERFLRRLASPGATSIKTNLGGLGQAFSTIAKVVSGR